MANTKITKKEMYGRIMELCKDNAEIVEFCTHEVELLAKKSSKASSKKDNDHIVVINEIKSALEVVGVPITITDLMKTVPAMANYSNQKISAMLKKMVESGMVNKKIDKKKSYFSLADVEETE